MSSSSTPPTPAAAHRNIIFVHAAGVVVLHVRRPPAALLKAVARAERLGCAPHTLAPCLELSTKYESVRYTVLYGVCVPRRRRER